MFTFGELTAGVGTGRLALEKLGCTPVWSCEIDPACGKELEEDGREWKCDGNHSMISDTMSKCQECGSTKTQYSRITYHSNFGEYPTYGNIRELKNPPYVDIIVSGFPCPSFSVAGQRKGFEDTRGEVFFEVARIIDEVQPKAFILENVKGLLSHDKGRTFKTIKKTLRNCGYILYNKLLNSTRFGVPQNRERVYFVGFRKDLYAPFIDGAFVYPRGSKLDKTIGDLLEENVNEKYYLSEKMIKCLLKHLERHKEKGSGYGMRVLNPKGISHCPITANYAQNPDDALVSSALGTGGMSKEKNLVSELIEKSKTSGGPQISDGSDIARTFTSGGHNSRVHSNSTIILQKPSPSRGSAREYKDVCPTLAQKMGAGGHNVPMNIQKNQRNEVIQKKVSGSVHHSMASNQAPKIATNGMRLRKLTPLECFRLQGFPDEFVKKAIEAGISDTQLYRQAGNAFTLTVVEAVAEKVVKKLTDLT